MTGSSSRSVAPGSGRLRRSSREVAGTRGRTRPGGFVSPPDAPARARIKGELDTTLFVEAAAGTGKTTELVGRIAALLRSDRARIENIAAITFTERAAGDLRLRIRQVLEATLAKGSAPEERERLKAALSGLENASISTIHGFCVALLRRHPVEAGVDPDFEILSERDRLAFFEPVFRQWLRDQLEDPGPGVARILRRTRNPMDNPIDRLRDAALRLLDHRDLDGGWRRPQRRAEREIRTLLSEDEVRPVTDDFGEPVEITDPRTRRPIALTRITPSLSTIAQLVRLVPSVKSPSRGLVWVARSLAEAAELEREIETRLDSGAWDPDWIEQALATLRVGPWGHKGYLPLRLADPEVDFSRFATARAEGEPAFDMTRLRDDFAARLTRFQKRANADVAARLREDLRPLTAAYEAAKARAGTLDFDDLLLRTRAMLREHRSLRADLNHRYTHVLVDEYQDTDPIQTEILLLLTSPDPPDGDWSQAVPAPGRLFLVGDPKQSIYRFRRADIGQYRRTKKRLLAAGAAEVRLTANFRATAGMCEFVNEVFEPLLGARPSGTGVEQVGYSPIHGMRPDLPRPLLTIPVPEDGSYALSGKEISTLEPDAVGSFVGQLLASRCGVSVPGGGVRAIEASDICLLFRRFRDRNRFIPDAYALALARRNIPHSLAAVASYSGSPEIHALRSALTAVEFPDDEIAVYATLRGPLFAISDEELLLFIERRGKPRAGPQRALAEDAPPWERTVVEELDFLGELHRERNRRPLALTIQRLLDRNRGETGFMFWKSPDQVLANVRRFTQAAREFDAGGGLSLRGLLRELEIEARALDRGAAHGDPDVRGVRMTTVHSAKGLEFPVVVLVDSAYERTAWAERAVRPEKNLHACNLGGGLKPQDLLDAAAVEEAEDLFELDRLLYVAATRARDALVCVHPRATYLKNSWLAPIYDRLDEREAEGVGRAVSEPASDPRWALLSSGAARSPQQAGKPVGDDGAREGPSLSEFNTVGFASFVKGRTATLAEASRPTLPVETARAYAQRDFDPLPVVEHALPHLPGRPAGIDFGLLVHGLLERAPLGETETATGIATEAHGAAPATPGATPGEAEVLAREIGVDPALAQPAAAAASAALDHEVLRAARRAAARGACFREYPLGLREENPAPPSDPPAAGESANGEAGTERPLIIEGVVDLLFQEKEAGPWTVVDFKTSRTTAARPTPGADHPASTPGLEPSAPPWAEEQRANHRRQVSLYARAVARATGEPAQPVLLYV